MNYQKIITTTLKRYKLALIACIITFLLFILLIYSGLLSTSVTKNYNLLLQLFSLILLLFFLKNIIVENIEKVTKKIYNNNQRKKYFSLQILVNISIYLVLIVIMAILSMLLSLDISFSLYVTSLLLHIFNISFAVLLAYMFNSQKWLLFGGLTIFHAYLLKYYVISLSSAFPIIIYYPNTYLSSTINGEINALFMLIYLVLTTTYFIIGLELLKRKDF